MTISVIFCSYQAKAVNSAKGSASSALQISVGGLLKMNAKEFAQQSGQKLTMKERIIFGMVKGKLKSEVRKGNLSYNDSPAQVVSDATAGFSLVGFLLGAFLSFIGFLLVWLFMDRNALKWAFWGMILSFIIYGGLLLV